MQYHVLLSRAKATFHSFHIQMRKIQSRESKRNRDRVIKRKGRCWHVYRQQQRSPGVNMREGEWNTTERRGRHTGVSEHSAPGPMVEWCLRDKAEAYTPRHVPQGPLLLCQNRSPPHLPSLFMHCITEWTNSDGRETQEVTSLGASLCCFSGCADA